MDKEMEMRDFKELTPDDNVLSIWADDFPSLMDKRAGREVMFCVRGVIKSQESTDKGPKILVSLVDGALMSGEEVEEEDESEDMPIDRGGLRKYIRKEGK